MKILLQIGIVFLVCLVGEWISAVLPFAFPGSVIAMILLFLLLLCKVLKVEHIEQKASFVLNNMAFFFIPAGVGMVEYFDVLGTYLVPFLVICTVSTVLTFAVTAWTVTGVMRLQTWILSRKEKQNGKLD